MDVEQLAGLYQRRYNIMSELNKETDEVLLAAESEDNVSMDLLLDLRQESLGRLEENDMQIRTLMEESPADAKLFRVLTGGESDTAIASNLWEKKVMELSRKTGQILSEIKRKNQRLAFRAERRRDNLADKLPL